MFMSLVGFGFRSSLILLAISTTLAVTFVTPRYIKQAIQDSGIYAAAAGILSDRSSLHTDDPTAEPAYKRAVSEALPPDQIRSASEQIIDGTYRWLVGSAVAPDFRIDTVPAVSRFKSVISDEALRRTGTLPPSVTPQAVRDQAIAQATGSNRVFSEPFLTADSIPKNRQGLAFYDASVAPTAYKILMLLPWAFGIICLLLAGVIFLVRHNNIRAGYDLATIVLRTGIVILILAGLAHMVFILLTQPGGGIVRFIEGNFQQYIIAFIRSLEWVLSRTLLLLGATYLTVGGLVIVGLRLVASRRLRHMDDNAELTPLAPIAPLNATTPGTVFGAAAATTSPGATIVPQSPAPGVAIAPSTASDPTAAHDEQVL